jgi:hypothetical protein
MAFFREFHHGNSTVVVEDDGNVCYAYLIQQGSIVSDVWLYNHGTAPLLPPWKSPDARPPFQNSSEFLLDPQPMGIPSPEELSVVWDTEEGHVVVCLSNVPLAWLTEGAKPGWSARVKRDGPVAQVRKVEQPS